jgi:hypothetical protein
MFTVPSTGAVAPRPFVRRFLAARLFAAFSLFLLACPRPAVAQNSPPAMLERILAPVSVSEFFTYADLPQAPEFLITREHDPVNPWADYGEWRGDTHTISWMFHDNIVNYVPGANAFREAHWDVYSLKAVYIFNWLNPDGSPGTAVNGTGEALARVKYKTYMAGGNPIKYGGSGIAHFSARLVKAGTNIPYANPTPVSFFATFTVLFRSSHELTPYTWKHVEDKWAKTDVGTIPVNIASSATKGNRLYPRQYPLAPTALLASFPVGSGRPRTQATPSAPLVPGRSVLMGEIKITDSVSLAWYDDTPTIPAAQIDAEQNDLTWVPQAQANSPSETTTTSEYTNSSSN